MLVIVLSTATALVALRSTIRQTERTGAIDRRIALVDHLRGDARELARSARRFLLTGDGKEKQRVLAIEAEMHDERARLTARDDGLDEALDRYVGAIVHHLGGDRDEPGVALARFEDDLLRVRGSLSAAFEGVIGREHAKRDASRSSQRLARGAQWALVIAAGLGIVLTIGSTLALRYLLRRYADRMRGAEQDVDRVTMQRKELHAASDELRGPLAKIMTQATALRTTPRPAEETRVLQSIASSAARVDNLLGQLLDVTAVQAGNVSLHRVPCDVATLVDRAIDQQREAARERGMRLRYEARLALTVAADFDRITNVLTSLLGCAIAAARIGAEIVMSAAPTDDGVRIALSDAGVTVPLPSTFAPPVAAPPNDLALQLAQRVIEAHGGRFGIEAATAGRTYWFTLPTEPRLLR